MKNKLFFAGLLSLSVMFLFGTLPNEMNAAPHTVPMISSALQAGCIVFFELTGLTLVLVSIRKIRTA